MAIKAGEIVQWILGFRSEKADSDQRKQIAGLEKKIENLTNNGPVLSVFVLRDKKAQATLTMSGKMASAKTADAISAIEKQIEKIDAEYDALIAEAEAKEREAQAKQLVAEAEAKEKKTKAESWHKARLGAILGVLGILFLVVFTPVKFIDILIAGAVLGAGYGIWRWKK